MLRHDPSDWDAAVRSFEWSPPKRFNMAAATVGRATDDLALLHVLESGAQQRYTFADLDQLSDRLGNALRGLGVQSGDRVGVLLPQRPEVPLTHLAAWKVGAVSQPLSTLFGPDALTHRLADATPKVVVCLGDDVDKVAEVCTALEQPPALVVVDAGEAAPAGAHRFDDLLRISSSQLQRMDTAAEDPALLSYTSGTTGAAKGVLHAHRTLLGHLAPFQLMHSLAPQPGDLSWTPADWAWMGGFMDSLFPSWSFGIPVLSVAGRFDPEQAWRVCAEHRVRTSFLPPTALRLMRDVCTPQLAAGVDLRAVCSGGETLGADVLDWAQDVLGVRVNEIYGQTEANLVVGNCSALFDPVPGSMGRAYPGMTVQVLDESAQEAPRGTLGEIAVRADAPTAFLGYWRNPDATAAKLRDGWILTGDSGLQDDTGAFWYRARNDDVISSAGYRIGPGEIEACLVSHPAVRLAAAVGVPDAVRGEAVKAFVELSQGAVPSPELAADIQRHVRERLAAYLYPRQVEFVDSLPLTTTGKIRRTELRDRAAADS
jgi:acetyl-CoA synthetase